VRSRFSGASGLSDSRRDGRRTHERTAGRRADTLPDRTPLVARQARLGCHDGDVTPIWVVAAAVAGLVIVDGVVLVALLVGRRWSRRTRRRAERHGTRVGRRPAEPDAGAPASSRVDDVA
jgi:hypothetical protein